MKTKTSLMRALPVAFIMVFLAGMLLPVASATAADFTFYLRNSGPTAFNFTLLETAGTATTETNTAALKTYKDTTINSTTTFASIGTWVYTGSLADQALADLGSASLWVGLATTDSVGLKAIVRVEVLKNSTVVSTVDSAILSLARVPSSATGIDLPAPSPAVHFGAGDILSLRLSAKVSLPGHAAGILRLHYNRSNRASNFGATINPDNPEADLSVTKTDSPDPVLQGQNLLYTITVTNNGPAQATGVTLTDTLPAGVAFVSATSSQGSYSGTTTVIANLGAIDNGNSAVVTITVKPGAEAADAGTITNTATVSSSSTDSNSINDTATADTVVTPDTDGDGIPDAQDCSPTIADDIVVDPNGVVPATFTGLKVSTLQLAVIAALDNDMISMYGNTVENVVIGNSTGSGGKDLLIIGCGHRVTAASGALPVIHVEVSAGADDSDSGRDERDIEFVDVDVRNGSGGYLIETSKVAGVGTDTLLKGVRAESSSGVGIKVAGSGNEVRGSNGVNLNAGLGIQVIGNANLITENRVDDNVGAGIDVTGNDSLIKKNKVGDEGSANGAGIRVAGSGNDLLENDVFANFGDGINVSGAGNLIQKNDVGDRDKGNAGDGIHVAGAGNTLDENNVFANTGDGIDVNGGTFAGPNVVKKNDVGDRNKGNLGNGILVGGLGNGLLNPVEIDENTVKSNALAGIMVTGSGHHLRKNASGGSGDETNGGCEYDLAAGNFDAGDNKANGATVVLTIPGCTGSGTL